MPSELAALVAVLLSVVGVLGIVIPVLPGSFTVVVALLVWAVWGSSSFGWVVFGVGLVLVAAGATASFVLTKRNLDAKQVPQWPVTIALLVGVVMSFVLPALGLVLGFVVTLLLVEWFRVKSLRGALSTSGTAIKSIGIGMLLELSAASLACTLLAVSIVTALVL